MHAAAVADAPAPAAPPTLPYRVGHGFDLHRLAEGYKLVIGGVEIPHTKGCEAHSDGGLCQWVAGWGCRCRNKWGPRSRRVKQHDRGVVAVTVQR